jgi:hypothetical protein
MPNKNILADRVVLVITGTFLGWFTMINKTIYDGYIGGYITDQYLKSYFLFSLFEIIIFTILVHQGIYAIADFPVVIQDLYRKIRKNGKGKNR